MKLRPKVKICKGCGQLFSPKESKIKYCDRNCYFRNKLQIIERNGQYYKHCSKCNEEKLTSVFDLKRNVCKICRKTYKKDLITKTYISPLSLRFKNSLKYSQKRKKEWNISFEEYCEFIKSQCFYCNSLLGKRGVGLDRIDNLLGYTVNNVVSCCGRCNMFRSDMYSFGEFCKFSNLIKQIDQEKLQDRLINLVATTNAVEFGNFDLSSGKKSEFYFDASKLVFHSESVNLIAKAIIQLINFSKIDVIVGPIMGAIPILSSVLCLLGYHHIQKRGAFFRKETKTYGKVDLVEGNLSDGDRVLIVDDVATSGLSILKLADNLRENNFSVVEAITILDREQGASELLFANSIPFKSILNISQIL